MNRPHWRASPKLQVRARELRHDMTLAERQLWQHIRKGQIAGAHFRKQHAVGTYIVDFFCAQAKLVIEVDGDTHAERVEYDAQRTQWLNEQKHYRVIRFANAEILKNIESVIKVIAEALEQSPPLRSGGGREGVE